jgi:hypothetical protein
MRYCLMALLLFVSTVAAAAGENALGAYPQRHLPPKSATSGLALSLTLYAPQPLSNPQLMYRQGGEHRYKSVAFEAQPDGYFVAIIPPEDVVPPTLQYYIILDAPGQSRLLARGNPETPVTVAVEGGLNEGLELKRYGFRNEVRLMVETVQYPEVVGKGSDYYYRYEAEYLYRIFGPVYSFRFGTGELQGKSNYSTATAKVINPLGQVEERKLFIPKDIGFLYSYLEAELRHKAFPVAFINRAILGADTDGVGGGWQGRLRIGDELGVNFVAGATIVSKLGFEGFGEFNIRPSHRTFVTLASHVENLPLKDELGYRSHLDLKLLLTDNFSLLLRGGAAARDVRQIGYNAGLGAALSF